MQLTVNERAEDPEFAVWLMLLGNGQFPRPPNSFSAHSICIPRQLLSDQLVKDLFGATNLVEDAPAMSAQAILCPKNEHARLVNEDVLNRLEGNARTYVSIDHVKADQGEDEAGLQVTFSIEFL
jgi:hypothetical protein